MTAQEAFAAYQNAAAEAASALATWEADKTDTKAMYTYLKWHGRMQAYRSSYNAAVKAAA